MANYSITSKIAGALALAFAIQTINLDACTGIKLVAKDGSFVHGRTLEFGVKVDVSLAMIPRGYDFTGTTPQGKGLSYKSKYAAVGAIAYDNIALMDGINEKGLAVGSFYFPGYAEYAEIDSENQSDALSPVDFSNWILTQFATVEEVKNALSDVVIAPTVLKGWGPASPPLHYIVYDKSGKCLVIEPINGDLESYETELGVLTNSPEFEWHMTNLRNFINLTPYNVKPLKVDNVELAPFGQGSGMVGLPGDFTPPSRFVRAAIFAVTATPSETANEGVWQGFHILNQFDIPVGVARQKGEDGVIYTDYTLLTCMRDPQSLKYFFKTFENQTIRMVDMKKFDLDAKTIKIAKAADSSQSSVDFSSNLK